MVSKRLPLTVLQSARISSILLSIPPSLLITCNSAAREESSLCSEGREQRPGPESPSLRIQQTAKASQSATSPAIINQGSFSLLLLPQA